MYRIFETEQFIHWFVSLKDPTTRARLKKASIGNLGDRKPVGDDVWEMREVFGPGWRMYYILRESTVIIMLGGGRKSSQNKDIELAKALAQELTNEQNQNPSL